jgi:hypothetical protein
MKVVTWAKWAVLGLLWLLLLSRAPSLVAPVYRFPPPTPFTGEAWLNPYAGVRGPWLLANFHAHARAWLGLTNGHQSPSQLREAYRAQGYDVASVSNYMQVVHVGGDGPLEVPAYEHGFNVRKSHRLVLNPSRVSFREVPVPDVNGQQWVLDGLAEPGALVVVPHPMLRNGYSDQELAQLTGYQLMEVLSPFAQSEQSWEAALNAGRRVWAIGDDDAHDARKPHEVGAAWTLVAARERSVEGVLEALEAGAMVAFMGPQAPGSFSLVRAEVVGREYVVEFDRPVASVRFMGPDQVQFAEFDQVRAARLTLPPVAWVRVVALSDAGERMLLNPILRWSGHPTPPLEARVDVWASAPRWALLWLLALALGGLSARAAA